jgi:UDP-N-acetylglucosamine 2-epimerase
MGSTSCLIGNSSSGIREGAFIGTPVVNIGTRQTGRDRGKNVIDVEYNKIDIKNAIKDQLNIGKYSMEPIYGDGFAGKRIANILSNEEVNIQKCITY